MVAGGAPAQQREVQVGVEPAALLRGAALDRDARQPGLPLVARRAADVIEPGARHLGAQVRPGGGARGVGEGHLQGHRVGGATEVEPAAQPLAVDAGHAAPRRGRLVGREGSVAVQRQREVHAQRLGAAARRQVDHAPLQAPRVEAPQRRRAHRARAEGRGQVEQDRRLVAGGEGVAMQPDARRGRQLDGDAPAPQADAVVPRPHHLLGVGEGGRPALRAGARVDRAEDRHGQERADLPIVDVAEAEDRVVVVGVAAAPVALQARIRAEVDQPEGPARGGEGEPARLRGTEARLDQGGVVAVGRRGVRAGHDRPSCGDVVARPPPSAATRGVLLRGRAAAPAQAWSVRLPSPRPDAGTPATRMPGIGPAGRCAASTMQAACRPSPCGRW